MLGHEVRSFTACGASEALWVVDRTDGDLAGVYRKLTSEPYQQLFVEVVGRRVPVPDAAFAAEHAGALEIVALRRAARETHGCAEDPGEFAFRAFGSEPFWSLEIRNGNLRFTQLGEPARVFPHQTPELSGATRTYRSHADGPNGAVLEVAFHERRCIDPMSGEHFPFRARVRLGTHQFDGCARDGASERR
ncbi:MAG: hypothetical protein QNK03_01510 [Myxococcota bacterium]|nr:hypothetical protein [Myxococcota bacterium]